MERRSGKLTYFASLTGVERRQGERRVARRFDVALPVTVIHPDGLSIHVSGNLSRFGAYLSNAAPLPIGTGVTAGFRLPSDERDIACRAVVIAIGAQGLGMGLRFQGLSPDDARRIDRVAATVASEMRAA